VGETTVVTVRVRAAEEVAELEPPPAPSPGVEVLLPRLERDPVPVALSVTEALLRALLPEGEPELVREPLTVAEPEESAEALAMLGVAPAETEAATRGDLLPRVEKLRVWVVETEKLAFCCVAVT